MLNYLLRLHVVLYRVGLGISKKTLFLKNGAKLLLLFDMSKFFGKIFFEIFLKFSKTKSHFTHYQLYTRNKNKKSCPKKKIIRKEIEIETYILIIQM